MEVMMKGTMSSYKRVIALSLLFLGGAAPSVMADDVLRFSWWGGDSRHKPTLDAIKLFESKNPGVTVKGEYMGFNGYCERLTTQLSGGTEPDIMQVDWAWISVQFSKRGDGFYDLNKAKNVINLSAFGDGIKFGDVNGKLNAIPVSFTARFFLWQKAAFANAGVAFPKTWDDLFAVGKTFESKLGKDYYPIDGQLYDIINLAQTYMLQKTGKYWIDPKQPKVAYTKAEALEFVKIYKKFSSMHVVVPLDLRWSFAAPETPPEQISEWYNGKWGGLYTFDSTFMARVKPLPKTNTVDIGDFVTMQGAKNSGYYARPAMMFAVSKNSKKPLLAAKFIDFLLNNPEAINILGQSRGAPMSKIGYAQLVKENKLLPVEKKAIEQLRKAKVDVPSAYFEHSQIQGYMRSVFEQISFGKISDEKAVELLTTETDKILRSLSN